MRTRLGSRAVLRPLVAGDRETCAYCGDPVSFQPWLGTRKQQVIANVYVGDRWDRVERFHAHCYAEAGEPYGATG